MYPFGQDIFYTLFTGVNGERFEQLTTSQGSSGKLYVFTERPNRADALAGTGALSGAFALTVNNARLTTTITAIPDPDPTGDSRSVTYWISANFIKQTGGQEETLIRPLKLIRADAHDTEIGVDVDALLSKIPDLDGYLSTVEMDGMIQAAQREVKDELTARGIEWASIHKPEQLYWAVLWRSIQYVNESQNLKSGDRWEVAANSAREHFTSVMNTLKLDLEASGSGAVVTQQKARTWIMAVR